MRYYNAMLGVLGKHSKDDGKELGLPALLLGLFNRGFVVLLGLGFYDGVLRGFWKKLFICLIRLLMLLELKICSTDITGLICMHIRAR